MPKMIVSIDGVVIKEVQLTKDRTTLGRRPYNDIVIDNLAVSGEHAVVQLTDGQVFLEDLNSTNGTYVNGKAVKKQLLQDGDSVEVGKYKIKFVSEARAESFEKTMMVKAGAGGLAPAVAPTPLTPPAPTSQETQAGTDTLRAAIKVLSGAAAGREVPLTKVVTTIGKPGVAVAAITRRQRGFVVHHVEGAGNPTLNGASIGAQPVALRNGDLIELAGTQMQFVQA
ncbi:MAG: FHA domain-containing protein [Gammaproteobacteria bacterium]|uniref:FHA domain-containing protein n=1 Tax=Rhodoferax sp. TaxID=50421 RepID=UPI00184A7D4F|nr:FHA domain-containing protein [Rhodoferax sp.]MBU3898282.1 FHA domain-containing protein [Gammaproteobacteria bacterium]MBA3059020.1 FHA domain-containing protein [Rhodoferax sp.]MBU3998658.1 FHA domain-containing protein [Gammaproteobacteria bacterium]MBU4081467.1 FHA domain-containing protein [Gammaproteobacteria bacterium]MBU4114246.1 FHA domain-containing protein [Gammaproteobacteria bacterium]